MKQIKPYLIIGLVLVGAIIAALLTASNPSSATGHFTMGLSSTPVAIITFAAVIVAFAWLKRE